MEKPVRIKIFAAIAFYLFATNLLVQNGLLEWWPVERAHWTAADQPQNLPAVLLSALRNAGADAFSVRLPGLLVLLGTLVGFFVLGKKILRQSTVLYALLVAGSSLLLPNVAKFATSDIWLFAAQTFTALALIFYLKQPLPKWKIAGLFALFLGALVNPVSMALFVGLMGGGLFFLHKNGRQMVGLWLWLLPVLGGLAAAFVGLLPGFISPFEWTHIAQVSWYKYLIISFLGVFPWIGFALPGVWQTIQRVRRKEEFSIIMLCWLVGGLFSFSITPQLVLAILIAKQIEGFFDPRYPYDNAVKATSLIHLGVVLFGAIYLILISWENLKGLGFRTAMMTTLFYWMGTLLAFIGLYGKNRSVIIGGLAAAGLLGTWFFWTKAFPVFLAGG